MNALGILVNVALLGGLVLSVWAGWKWREAVHSARFRLEPVVPARGPWVRVAQGLFVVLIGLEVVFAISQLVNATGGFGPLVSGSAVNRLLVAALLVVFLLVYRAGPLSGAALLREDAIHVGWGIAARYADVQSVAWLEGDVLLVRTAKSRFYFVSREKERESIARFLGEKTGKVVPLPGSAA